MNTDIFEQVDKLHVREPIELDVFAERVNTQSHQLETRSASSSSICLHSNMDGKESVYFPSLSNSPNISKSKKKSGNNSDAPEKDNSPEVGSIAASVDLHVHCKDNYMLSKLLND